jgi:hypothetical protein
MSNQRLSVIDPRRPVLRVIATGDESTVSASADGNRVAVLCPDDTVGIYSASGALLKQITLTSAKEIAYGGAAWSSSPMRGRSRCTTPRAERSCTRRRFTRRRGTCRRGTCAYGRIGLYFVDARHLTQYMHLVDLATGEELVLPATLHPWGSANAAVGPLGVVHSVNTYCFGSSPKRAGTLVFLPTTKVLAMFGGA